MIFLPGFRRACVFRGKLLVANTKIVGAPTDFGKCLPPSKRPPSGTLRPCRTTSPSEFQQHELSVFDQGGRSFVQSPGDPWRLKRRAVSKLIYYQRQPLPLCIGRKWNF